MDKALTFETSAACNQISARPGIVIGQLQEADSDIVGKRFDIMAMREYPVFARRVVP